MKDKNGNSKNARSINQVATTIQSVQSMSVSDKPMTVQEKTVLKESIIHLTPE
jgi:hypothetical protein